MQTELLDETAQRDALRRMKVRATALLVATALTYLLAARVERAGAPGWVGYLAAAAEAGTVGGLADWFAVTALFRHPLGLPIPHTAILPTRKDALGRSLERFVAENFLAEDVVRDKLRRADVARRVGLWLSDDANAARAASGLATAIRGAVTVLRDEDVQRMLEQLVVRRLADVPAGPPLGRLLGAYVAEGAHRPLVDVALDRAGRWLEEHPDAVLGIVLERAPAWSPRFVDERVATHVYHQFVRFVHDVRADPQHRVRVALDGYLARLARDLQHDPDTIARAERFKARLLSSPEVGAAVAALWTTTKRILLDMAGDPSNELRGRVAQGLAGLGRRLGTDAELRAKVDRWVEDAVASVVTGYRDALTAIIGETVARWDPADTARRVELQVGRDLQFIRINGTVVGAAAGLAIHAVAALVA